jgi:DHA1 family bicyclomycin/chloramphenicol resistance-like MFS transporter
MAILNGVMNASAGIAPVIGSYITLHFHWQGNFTTLLILGLIVFLMTMLFIPASKTSQHKKTPSLQGYISIFQSKPLMLLITHFAFMFVPYWIFVGMSPILYIEDLGVSLSHFGYYQGSLALVFAFGSLLYGFVITRYNQRKMLLLSCFIWIIGLIMLALISFLDNHKPLLITFAFLPFCIGQIIPTTVLYPVCLNYMPQAKGRVSAIIQGGRLVLAALGLQVAGYFYQGTFQNIGMIIIFFIFLAAITLLFVLKNRKLMKLLKE